MKRLVILAALVVAACSTAMPPAPGPANGGKGFYKGGTYPASHLSEGGNPDKGADGK